MKTVKSKNTEKNELTIQNSFNNFVILSQPIKEVH